MKTTTVVVGERPAAEGSNEVAAAAAEMRLLVMPAIVVMASVSREEDAKGTRRTCCRVEGLVFRSLPNRRPLRRIAVVVVWGCPNFLVTDTELCAGATMANDDAGCSCHCQVETRHQTKREERCIGSLLWNLRRRLTIRIHPTEKQLLALAVNYDDDDDDVNESSRNVVSVRER
jgi:hypothetical protein